MKLLLLTTLMAQLAMANGINTAGLMSEPQPVRPGGPSFEKAMEVWSNGVSTNQNMLLGHWKMVMRTAATDCSVIMTGSNVYNPEGFKNGDGSFRLLNFKMVTSEDFGERRKQALVVDLLNLGEKGKNQGPYALNSKLLQFSQWAYRAKMTQDLYFEYSCKGMKGDSRYLVCAVGLKIKNENNLTSGAEKMCAALNYGLVYGYVKVSDSQP